MAEQLPRSPEKTPGLDPELQKQGQEALRDLHEKAERTRHEHAEKIESIRHHAEREAASAEVIKTGLKYEQSEPEQPLYVNRELKNIAYQRTLKRARSHLSAPNRALSKIIHQPTVEAISEFGAKTVARPSGILAGGIIASLGTGIVLWIDRHYGYEYNFLLLAILFVGGFFLGLLLELIIRLVRQRKS